MNVFTGCSQHSYCGSTFDYCNTNTCQKGYGSCNAASSSSSRQSSATRSSSASVRSSSSLVASSSTTKSSSVASSVSSSASPTQSSSSLIVSSSSASPTPTPVPQPGCKQVSTCEPFTGDIIGANQACPGANNKCQYGYQAQCGQYSEGEIISGGEDTDITDDGGQCRASCDANASCIGFYYRYTGAGHYYCVLFSSITSSSGGDNGNTFLKVCPNAVVASN